MQMIAQCRENDAEPKNADENRIKCRVCRSLGGGAGKGVGGRMCRADSSA